MSNIGVICRGVKDCGLAAAAAFVLLFALSSCSSIGEDERIIYEKLAPAQRTVLLEDFTGQRCVNCPRGTEVIEDLQSELGDSVVIAVGIHGGPLGFMGSERAVGLATEEGNEYFDHWNLDYQPVGLINRHGAVNYTEWAKKVKEEQANPSPLTLAVSAAFEGETIDIIVNALGTDGNTDGKLQVWLLEDSITAMQMMPDGTTDRSYVHNHVLRAPVNGLWGQDFSVREGERQSIAMTATPDAAWKREHLSIVAFVYNDQGVQQAAKAKVE